MNDRLLLKNVDIYIFQINFLFVQKNYKIIIPFTTVAMTKGGPGTDMENRTETSTENGKCSLIYVRVLYQQLMITPSE